MKGRDGAIVRKWLRREVLGWKRWVSCRLIGGIRNRENKELATRMVTSSQVKKSRFLGKLRDS